MDMIGYGYNNSLILILVREVVVVVVVVPPGVAVFVMVALFDGIW